MNAAKTTAQRQAEFVARQKASGLVKLHGLWVYPEDVPAIRDAVAKLRAKRTRVNPNTQAPKIDRR